ncbi:DUF4328 domain-containing protein [Kitasatospora sp. NPDC048365]|uniref:DUF4328 domain-containing protein n=1 Tax=Kitasatospora sp. NPDC048365 TaxID=3364050 RepID=UPI00370FDBF0
MIPPQPRDPREPALGLQVSVVLTVACHLALLVLALVDLPGPAVLPTALEPVFLVTAYIVGTVWFRRCWANAALFTEEPLPYGPGWALAGWMVPVLSLWMRWRLLLALRRTGGAPDTDAPVHLWWALSLAADAMLLATLLGRAASGSFLYFTVFWYAGPFTYLLIVRRITARQVELLPPAPAAEPVAV